MAQTVAAEDMHFTRCEHLTTGVEPSLSGGKPGLSRLRPGGV